MRCGHRSLLGVRAEEQGGQRAGAVVAALQVDMQVNMGMWGHGDVGTWECGDTGTWGHGDMGGDMGTWGCGDTGPWGHGDVGTQGHEDVGMWDTGTWGHGVMGM